MSDLAAKTCIPCQGGVDPLKGSALKDLADQLTDWSVADEHHLIKTYTFGNFVQALDFTNRVGDLAEEQNHHPDIHLSWGEVRVEIWTHKIDGLTESDFIFAAKCDSV